MGRAIAELAAPDPTFQVIGGLDHDDAVRDGSGPFPLFAIADAGPILGEADVVIDFSAPVFLTDLVSRHADALAAKALVIGTTGLDEGARAQLDRAAARTAVLTAANFSVGVNLLLALTEQVASVLDSEFDVEIVEAHHRRKEDAPSGTALALGEAVAAGRKVDLTATRRDGRSGRPGPRPDGEIAFHSLRGGDVIGDHEVHFIGGLERITLAHRAADRRLFAAGALRAAGWLPGHEPGRYTMRDVLGF